MNDRELLEKTVGEELRAKLVRFKSDMYTGSDERLQNTGAILADTGSQYMVLYFVRWPVGFRGNTQEKIVFETGCYFPYNERDKEEVFSKALDGFESR